MIRRLALGNETISKGKSRLCFYKEEIVSAAGNSGSTRGEMDADELWVSTLDPAVRKLIPATPENFGESYELLSKVMGSKPGTKKTFIQEHAKEYSLTAEDDTAFDVEAE